MIGGKLSIKHDFSVFAKWGIYTKKIFFIERGESQTAKEKRKVKREKKNFGEREKQKLSWRKGEPNSKRKI